MKDEDGRAETNYNYSNDQYTHEHLTSSMAISALMGVSESGSPSSFSHPSYFSYYDKLVQALEASAIMVREGEYPRHLVGRWFEHTLKLRLRNAGYGEQVTYCNPTYDPIDYANSVGNGVDIKLRIHDWTLLVECRFCSKSYHYQQHWLDATDSRFDRDYTGTKTMRIVLCNRPGNMEGLKRKGKVILTPTQLLALLSFLVTNPPLRPDSITSASSISHKTGPFIILTEPFTPSTNRTVTLSNHMCFEEEAFDRECARLRCNLKHLWDAG
jgi:hypothetical protein